MPPLPLPLLFLPVCIHESRWTRKLIVHQPTSLHRYEAQRFVRKDLPLLCQRRAALRQKDLPLLRRDPHLPEKGEGATEGG